VAGSSNQVLGTHPPDEGGGENAALRQTAAAGHSMPAAHETRSDVDGDNDNDSGV